MLALATLVATLSLADEVSGAAGSASAFNTAYRAAQANLYDEDAFNAFLRVLPRRGSRFLVDGDLPMTAREVYEWLVSSRTMGAVALTASVTPTGKLAVWSSADRGKLTFAIDRQSFGERYAEIKSAFITAAAEWSEVCPECGIQFQHLEELDSTVTDDDLSSGKVKFIVRMTRRDGYVAVAFFPTWPVATHVLEITDQFFTSKWGPVEILRHEIGHILGYRHEHVRTGTCEYANGEWKDLTPYDGESVMEAPCGDRTKDSFAFSSLDREAHRRFYAPPLVASRPAPASGAPDPKAGMVDSAGLPTPRP